MKKLIELKKTIFYDLEALKDNVLFNNAMTMDFDYHFNLLKGNLKDLFKKINQKRRIK